MVHLCLCYQCTCSPSDFTYCIHVVHYTSDRIGLFHSARLHILCRLLCIPQHKPPHSFGSQFFYATCATCPVCPICSKVASWSVESLDPLGHRGNMRGNSAEILFRFFLQEVIVSSSGIGKDVHSLVLSIQYFLCRP